MKAKLITLSILSLLVLIGLILFWTNDRYEIYTNYWGDLDERTNSTFTVSVVLIAFPGIVSFIMGIIVLSTNRTRSGLATATGILALLGGCFGVNIVLGLMGAFSDSIKESNYPNYGYQNFQYHDGYIPPQPVQNSAQTTQEEVEKLRKELEDLKKKLDDKPGKKQD